VLWHTFKGQESVALQALSDRFNAENPWGTVLITEYQEDILDKLKTAAPEHRPDLIVLWPEDIPPYLQSGLMPSPPLLPSDIKREGEDLLPMARSLYTFNGELAALPLGLATYLLYYNADWLGDLGYEIADADWELVRRAACAATNPLGTHVGLGMPSEAGVFLAVLASGGATLVGEDGRYHFDDAYGVQTSEMLQDLLGLACGTVYGTWENGIPRLGNGAIAMLIESSLQLPRIERTVIEERNFALGVGMLPSPPEEPGRTLWYGPGLIALSTEATRQEAAVQVMAWFFSADAQTVWSVSTNYLPVRRSLIEMRQNASESIPERRMLRMTLEAAEAAYPSWVTLPQQASSPVCQAALVRTLFSFRKAEGADSSRTLVADDASDEEASVPSETSVALALEAAVNACNMEEIR
jgi:ABC-type glycerol-3-phosphate transport system substrate-binding protein